MDVKVAKIINNEAFVFKLVLKLTVKDECFKGERGSRP